MLLLRATACGAGASTLAQVCCVLLGEAPALVLVPIVWLAEAARCIDASVAEQGQRIERGDVRVCVCVWSPARGRECTKLVSFGGVDAGVGIERHSSS